MEHPRLTKSCSAPASGFGVSEVPVPSCCLGAGGLGVFGEGVRGCSSSHPLQGSVLILGSLERDLGPRAVVLLIPERVFHRSLCVQTLGLCLCLLIRWEGQELKALGIESILDVFCFVCGTSCILLRDWQHEENLENAGMLGG